MNSETAANANDASNPWRQRLLVGAVLLIAAATLFRLQMAVAWQLATPFDLVYEGPNLATIQEIQNGANIYAPSTFDAHRFVATMYTPLFHLICAALPASDSNPFLTGRLVGLFFMFSAALGAFLVSKSQNWAVSVLWLGPFLLLHPVVSYLACLKNDGTGLFFSALAILTVRGAVGHPRKLALAALFCVLAVASKQVFLASAASCFTYLFLVQRKDCLRFGLFYALFAGLAAAAAQIQWGSGFWWSTFSAPSVPMTAHQFTAIWQMMLVQPTFLLLLAAVLFTVPEQLWRSGKEQLANPFLLYVLFSGAVLLLTLGKVGSGTNYFIEPSLAAVFWLISTFQASWIGNMGRPVVIAACVVATIMEVAFAKPESYTFAHPKALERRAEFYSTMHKEVSTLVPDTNGLRVLNLASANMFQHYPGEAAVNDPYFYMLLWRKGALPPDNLIREVSARKFGLIVFWNDTVVQPGAENDPVGQVFESVCRSYRLAARGARLQYWLPMDQAAAN
jgi:hypothetical protein